MNRINGTLQSLCTFELNCAARSLHSVVCLLVYPPNTAAGVSAETRAQARRQRVISVNELVLLSSKVHKQDHTYTIMYW